MPHDLPAAGAERHANRDLALACSPAGKQQVCDVRARDQQHHPYQPLQHQQRPLETLSQLRESTSGRNERHRLAKESFPRIREFYKERILQFFLLPLVVKNAHRGLRTFDGHARLKAREKIEPRIAFVVEILAKLRRNCDLRRDGRPELREQSGIGPSEFGSRHAGDREPGAVQLNRGAHYLRTRAEPVPPEIILEHDDGVGSSQLVILHRQHAPDVRPDAQRLEEVAGHPCRIEHLTAFPAHHAHPRRAHAGHAGEDRILAAQRNIERIGKRVKPVAALRTNSAALHAELDQLLRILDRHHP